MGAEPNSPEEIADAALRRLAALDDRAALEELRVDVLGKKGSLTLALRALGGLPAAERPVFGQRVNAAKARVQTAWEQRDAELKGREREGRLVAGAVDVTLPSAGTSLGHVHPITRTLEEICDVLATMGFEIAEGPEIEDEYHNFEALNIAADHPARDMQDTFFVEGGCLLRTHTSPVQIRVMETRQPPIRIIAPGAVYRRDDDMTHSPMFHQVEGLLVDRDVSLADLKGVLRDFLGRVFERDVALRLRPSFFPFTEPSAEIDIGCVVCAGSGGDCRVCKGTGWLEILGAGMVDPAVFAAVGYDPEQYGGFAFGLGVERIAMLKYGIDDLRSLFAGDLRFLRQF